MLLQLLSVAAAKGPGLKINSARLLWLVGWKKSWGFKRLPRSPASVVIPRIMWQQRLLHMLDLLQLLLLQERRRLCGGHMKNVLHLLLLQPERE